MTTVLAVDGGNSKTDVALVAADGRLLGAARGGSTSHQAVGLDVGMARLAGLVDVARSGAEAGTRERPVVGAFALAGADTPRDVRLLERALATRGFAARDLVRVDVLAVIRAGTDRGWGVGLICGAGVNAMGIGPDGRSARLDALGDLSGDWGGGTDVGWEGLAAAVRARDGRGGPTVLERAVPAAFGLATPRAVTMALYRERLATSRIRDLAPVVFDAATEGDEVARRIVDRLADELIAMARAMLVRVRLTSLDPEVMLGGGVFRATDRAFYDRLEAGILAVAPRATIVRPTAPPVAGAALLALDEERGEPVDGAVAARVREMLRTWDASLGSGPAPPRLA